MTLAAAGVAWGLYLGERGRRQSAESFLVFGAPDAQPARSVMPHPLPAPIEPTQAPKGFDSSTVERGADQIMAEAAAAGMTVTRNEAVKLAENMLTAAMAGGDDLSIP